MVGCTYFVLSSRHLIVSFLFFFPFLLVKSKMLEGLKALEPVELYKYCFSEPVTETLGRTGINQ